jgi:hypothetical protein
MSTPQELGWTELVKNGKTVYVCQGEETPNKPTIKCDLPAGWEHVRSKSTGKTYYKCAAGAGGKVITQWAVPTTACNASTQPVKNAANKGQAPPESEQYEVIGTPAPNATNSSANSPVAFPRIAKLKINLENGTGEHEYTLSQDGGKKRRRRKTKKNRRAKNKRKSRRT